MTDVLPRCVKCGLVVDARGTNPSVGPPRYCRCICLWPGLGCHEPIYFIVNANERVQPFDYDGTPHHATCTALTRWKAQAKREQRPLGVSPLESFLK